MITITHATTKSLAEAVSDTLYRVQEDRDNALSGSSERATLRKASKLLDQIMNNLNDLHALAGEVPAVREAMEYKDNG